MKVEKEDFMIKVQWCTLYQCWHNAAVSSCCVQIEAVHQLQTKRTQEAKSASFWVLGK